MIQSFLGARLRRPGPGAEAGETRWAATDLPASAANGGSPAEVIRQRLLANRGDLTQAGAMVTLLDPALGWPKVVSHLLAPAAGESANTVDLRNLVGLLPGTRIERVALPLPGQAKVKVYAVESRHGAQRRSLAHALAERSHLTLVLASPVAPAAIDLALDELQTATAHPAWACPRLAFLLTPDCEAWRHRVQDRPWPTGLAVEVIDATDPSPAGAVVQGLRRAWAGPRPVVAAPTVLQAAHADVADTVAAALVMTLPAAEVAAPMDAPMDAPVAASPVKPIPAPAVTPGPQPLSLAELALTAPVRGLALVDTEFGQVLASAGQTGPALDTAASALAAALGLVGWRLGEGRTEELLLTRSDSQLLLHPSRARPRQALALVIEPGADLTGVRAALAALDQEPALARFQAG